MKLHLLHISCGLDTENVPLPEFDAQFDAEENNYYAIAVEDDERYYYWAKGASVRISKNELDLVRQNPHLYYFSTALRLHFRIRTLLNAGKPSTGRAH